MTEVSQELIDHLDKYPSAFVGFRVLRGSTNPGYGEVPFVNSLVFSVLLIGYIFYKRLLHIILCAFNHSTSFYQSYDHVFVISSNNKYKYFSLIETAKKLQDSDQTIVLLCSPSIKKLQKSWEKCNLSTVNHKDLHRDINITKVFVQFLLSFFTTYKLCSIMSSTHKIELKRVPIAFNVIFLENIKYESIKCLTNDEPCIHTQAASPYLLKSTTKDRIFVYQHGTQWPKSDFSISVPFFTPITYLIWSEAWEQNFERFVHPNSNLIPVGSPWHDHLLHECENKQIPNHDILFISQCRQKGEKYKNLVKTLVEYSASNDIKLVIKLHPRENGEWYYNNNFGKYIQQFDDIDVALTNSRIAVTDCSSSFVESAVLNTPIIVADLQKKGFNSLAPAKNIIFAEDISEVTGLISDINKNNVNLEEGQSIIRLGESVDRIASITMDKKCCSD